MPYRRYGETLESVAAAIESVRADIENGADRATLLELLPAGAARNALDCALWDLEAKALRAKRVASRICRKPPAAIVTAYTLSLGTPEAMAAQARANAARPLLKVKIGGEGDIERIRAVVERRARAAASSSTPMKAGATPTSPRTWPRQQSSAWR